MKTFKINSTNSFEENPTDRQERISWWSQEKLKNAKVMVVGAGAIGNETLKNLALLGIGNIFIVDFDTISTSNLSRTVLFRKNDVGRKKAEVAAERVKELAFYDNIKIDWFHGDLVWDLGTGIYNEMDLVLGCLDNVEARMSINKQCWLTKTPWIDSGMYELGMRVEFYNPPEEPCYQCNLTPTQIANSNKRYSCDYAKLKAYEEDKIPTTQITSAIVSAIQVQEAIKFLCGQEVAFGKKIYFQGKNNDFDILSKKPNSSCTAHASYPNVISIPLNNTATLKELLEFVSGDKYSKKAASIDLRGDRTFVKKAHCRICLSEIKFMRPTYRIDAEEFICEICRKNGQSYTSTNVSIETQKETQEVFNLGNTNEDLLNYTLEEIGVPPMQIIAVFNKDNEYKYYKLRDDKILKNIN